MQLRSYNKKPDNSFKTKGNALVIILVMIALIAALTAVAMKSSSRSSGNMDTESARVQAEKLMRQAISFESAVNRVMGGNQCSENSVNFVNTVTTRVYTNANAPSTKACDVFDLAGAGLTYTNPNPSIFDSSQSGRSDYGQWVFTGTHCVLKIGSDENDACINSEIALIAIVPHISLPVCLQINSLNNITNLGGSPPEESYDESASAFTGSFTAITDPELGEGLASPLIKHTTGCLKNTSGSWADSYVFYHVLLAR